MEDKAAHLGKTLALAAVSEQTRDKMGDLLSAAAAAYAVRHGLA